MPLWNVNLRPWLGTNFKAIRPENVLVQYDGPLSFTFCDESGSLMFAHLSDEDDGVARYIVAPVMDRDIERLKRGTVSLHNVLNQPMVWVLDLKGWEVTKSWVGRYSDIADGVKPMVDAMLYPDLEPMIKLVVPDVRYSLGAVGVDALRYLIDGAEAAMRVLLSHLKPDGKTEYKLEAQQLAFNSIEIAFQPRKWNNGALDPLDAKDTTIPKVVDLLGKGLEWVSSRGNYQLPQKHERAILAAIRELTPKKESQILKIEVSGKVASSNDGQFVPLTTDTRTDINERIRSRKPRSILRVGLIREMDEDKRSFELRLMKNNEGRAVKFTFDPEQRDNVHRHLGANIFVRASGERAGGAYKLVDLVEEQNGS